MSYIGGKARGAAHILAVLNHPRFDDLPYLEPFVGPSSTFQPNPSTRQPRATHRVALPRVRRDMRG